MEFKLFEEILMTYKKGSEMISELYDIGFNLLDGKYPISDILYKQLQTNIISVYGEEGLEWVEWFIFENNYGEQMLDAYDNNIRICDTIENLYLYLEKK